MLEVVGAVVGLLAAVAVQLTAKRLVRRDMTHVLPWVLDRQQRWQPPTLADRIEQLRENLSESGSLIDEINAELQVQTTALERIRAEADENQRLAALHKNKTEAVWQLVATTIELSHGKSLRQQKRAQLVVLPGRSDVLDPVPLEKSSLQLRCSSTAGTDSSRRVSWYDTVRTDSPVRQSTLQLLVFGDDPDEVTARRRALEEKAGQRTLRP